MLNQPRVREKQRGVENSGEGKTYRKIGCPPPFVHALSLSLEGTGTHQTNPTFCPPNPVLEGVLLCYMNRFYWGWGWSPICGNSALQYRKFWVIALFVSRFLVCYPLSNNSSAGPQNCEATIFRKERLFQ